MTKDEALKIALDALYSCNMDGNCQVYDFNLVLKAVIAIGKVLEQTEQGNKHD
jgi:hypothetical protein